MIETEDLEAKILVHRIQTIEVIQMIDHEIIDEILPKIVILIGEMIKITEVEVKTDKEAEVVTDTTTIDPEITVVTANTTIEVEVPIAGTTDTEAGIIQDHTVGIETVITQDTMIVQEDMT